MNSSGMFRRILVETRIFVFYIYLTIFNGDNKLGSANTVLRLIAGGVAAKPLVGSAYTVQRAPTGGVGAKPLLVSVNTDWC